MKKSLALIIVACGLAGCSQDSAVTAEIQLFNEGVLVTSRDILHTQVRLLKSRTLLRDVVKELNLMDAWALNDADAVDKLSDAIVIRVHSPSHSLHMRVQSTGDTHGKDIIEQIGRSHTKFSRGTYDPTPPPRPPDFHPRDYPEGLPLSTNAIEYKLEMRIRLLQ